MIHPGPRRPSGYARVPEELDLTEFYAAKGFVSPSFEDDVMTGYIVNQELLDAWNAAHPNPDAAEQQAAAVRAQRDKLLADTDWTQTLDAPIDAATREACVHTGRHCGICRSKRGFRQTSSGRSCRRPPKPCPIP